MTRCSRCWTTALVAVLLLTCPVAALQEAPAGEEEAFATLTLSFTNNGLPLSENERGKFYLYEVDERKRYVDWGHSGRTAKVPEGTYDLVIRYENGEIEETITRPKFELKGDQQESIGFRVPVARLTVDITRGGLPIEPFTGSYSVYRSGQRDRPLLRKRPGTEVTIRPGTYDIEVAHRGVGGMKTQWVEGILVNGNAHESVELGVPAHRLAQMTVTLVEDGRPVLPEDGVWRVYDRGQRSSPLAERRSGEMLGIEKGIYDIGAVYSRDGNRQERWVVDVEFSDDREREIEMGTPRIALRVNIRSENRLLRGAWFSIYEAGQRDNPLLSARSGEEVELEPGTYDIGCFLREGGLRVDEWLRRRTLREPLSLDVDLDHRDASIQVWPRDSRRRRETADPRILIVMDSSSRMRARMQDGTRLEVALPAIAEGLSTLPSEVPVGLRAVGGEPDGERECRASSLRVAPHGSDAEALTDALARMQAAGAAPLTHALEETVADFSPGPENILVVVTAGADGCGGNLCGAAARLLRDGLVGRIFVIGFDMDRDQMRRLDCLGEQRTARSGAELTAALRDVIRLATGADDGTFSVFRSGRPAEWITGGAVGDKVHLLEGKYDIQIHSRGRSYSWDSVDVSGDFEAVAGRRPRRR